MTALLLLVIIIFTVISSQLIAISCKAVNGSDKANTTLAFNLETPLVEEQDFKYHFKLATLLINGSIAGNTLFGEDSNMANNTEENSTVLTSSDLASNATTTENPRARIIGGEPAHEGEFKYQLSIRLFGRHHCGASLISVDEVQLAITAAHCVREWLPEDVSLVAGDLTRSDTSGNEQGRQVIDIVKHENFEFIEGVPSYDIALMFIEKPFTENTFVGTIPLPNAGQETKGNVIVSGWGDDNPRYVGRPSDKLMKVQVPIVEFATCKKSYSILVDEFYDHFICAGYMTRGIHKDSCQGDSGGPVRSGDGGYLVGVISWGAGCGIPRFPGVNTKVSYFVDWINDQVRRYKTDSSSEEESREEEEEEGEEKAIELKQG